MRIFYFACFLIFSISLHAQPTFPENGPRDERKLPRYFTNAIIHIDAHTVLKNATLKIEDGKIIACSAEIFPENGVEVIDLKGKHIYPAFIDLYSDYGLPEVPKKRSPNDPQYERSENRATGWNDALLPYYNSSEGFSPSAKAAEKLLKTGFGAVLTHRHDGIARGNGALVLPGDGSANELLLESQVAAFYSFKKGSSTQKYPASLMGAIALLRQAEYDARWYASGGDEKERNITLEAWNKYRPLPQIFVLTEKNDIPRVRHIGEEFDKSFILKTAGDEYQRIEEVTNAGYPLIVPLNFPKAYDVTDPYDARLVSLQELKHWESAPSNPARLEEGGVPFCLTSHGIEKPKDFLKNLRKAVRYGLDSATAIDALTMVPAQLIGAEDMVGSLEPGKLANFIVTSGDLFDDETEILETWVSGQPHRHIDFRVTDVRGTYHLNLDNHIYNLVVKGKSPREPKAELLKIANKDTTKVDVKINVQGQLITLSFNPKNEHFSEVIRLSGNIHKDSRIWEGQAELADGRWLPWSSIRQKEKSKEQPLEAVKKDSLNSGTVWYPNRAFGWDSLPQPETIWFTGATVWTSSGDGIIENGEVLIHQGKILAVGKQLNVAELLPKGSGPAKELNLKGKHLTPGIIDEHSHIAISRGVNEGTKASSAEVRIGDAVNPDDINIFRQLGGGVTTVQQLHGSANPIGGQSSIIKLRWGTSAHEMAFENAPKFIKFALGENVKQSNWGDRERIRYPQSRMGVEQVYYDHFLRARAYDNRQKEVEKPARSPLWKRILKKDKKSEDHSLRVDLGLEALAEILKDERFISCHSYVQSEINMLMHVGDSLGFRVNTFTHILEGYKLADKLKEHGAGASTFSDWWAYKFEVKDAIPYNAALMHQQGLTVAMNSDDAEMGRRLNQEAAKAIKYGGVSEEEALKMVTINPAILLRIDERVGSLEPGKDADLVIWSDHPLSIYSKAEKTYVDGRCFFDRDRLKDLKDRDQKERARIMARMLADPEKNENADPSSNPNDKEYHCDDVDEEI